MDQHRLQFLFGDDADTVADEFDLDDESDRLAALDEYAALPDGAGSSGIRMAVRGIVAGQILADEPPEAWSTVRRLQANGLDRDTVMSQMTMILGEQLMHALDRNTLDDNPFDDDAYIAALASLPLPATVDVTRALTDVARTQQGIAADELVDIVVTRLGGTTEPTGTDGMSVIHSLVERVFDTMIYDQLHMIPPDLTVHVADLVDGRTFTHRFTHAEAELQVLSVGLDLGWHSRFDTVEVVIDGVNPIPIEQFSVEQDHLAWHGGDRWLVNIAPGSLLAITTTVTTTTDTATSANTDSTQHAGTLNSTDADELHATATITVLTADPPASDAAVAAVAAVRAAYDDENDEPGLPVSGEHIGLWVLFHRSDAFTTPQLPIGELCEAAGLAPNGGRVAHHDSVWRRELSHQRFNRVMDLVHESERRLTIGHALEVLDDPDADIDDVRTVLADCAEPEALDVLADALFDHHLFDVADQFERSSPHAPGQLFALVERAIAAARRPRETATAALPDRFGWLCGKASLWLGHCAGEPGSIADEMTLARATGIAHPDRHDLDSLDDAAVNDAFNDPIVFDAALHEGDLFTSFLRDRGALLPDDEQLLAASWQLVERSVHEIVSMNPGVGMTVRDLATGDSMNVRERTASHTMQPGERYCARIVPDGESHQMIGGVFPVPTGTEAEVLDLCASDDGVDLCAWVGRLFQPARVVHSPGMIDEMFDGSAIEILLDDSPDDDTLDDETIAMLGVEMSRQARDRWLDENARRSAG